MLRIAALTLAGATTVLAVGMASTPAYAAASVAPASAVKMSQDKSGMLEGAVALQGMSGAPATAVTEIQSKSMPALRGSSPAISGAGVSVAPGTNGITSATCPNGGTPLGGGGFTSGIHIFFTDSFASGNSWVIRGTNTGTFNETLTAYALCTNP